MEPLQTNGRMIILLILSISAGWQSSVWAHAIFNTLTIWLVIVTLGV